MVTSVLTNIEIEELMKGKKAQLQTVILRPFNHVLGLPAPLGMGLQKCIHG
jgi:hypothetical protein